MSHMSAWQHVSTSTFTRWKSRPFLGLLTSPPPSWQRPMAKVAPEVTRKPSVFIVFRCWNFNRKPSSLKRNLEKDLFERHCIRYVRYVFLFLSDPQIQSATSATWTSAFLRPSCSRPRLSATSCPYHESKLSKRQKENIGTSMWRRDDLDAQLYSWTFFQPNAKPTPWALWCSFCWHLSSQPLEICYFHR